MNRFAVLVTVFGLALPACKGDGKSKPNPEMVKELDGCKAAIAEKDGYIKDLEKRLAEADQSGEVVVRIEGDDFEIVAGSGKGPRGGNPKGDAQDAELYKGFVSSVRGSRAAIQKCYQAALKKNTALASRSVTLDIKVSYKSSGSVSGSSFNPRISGQFDACMQSITKNWKLPAMPRAVSFNYKQTLTPE